MEDSLKKFFSSTIVEVKRSEILPADYNPRKIDERKAEREALKAQEQAAKVAHMKEVKQQVRENAQKQADNMDAYLMLSFDTFDAKAAFCERFGYDPYTKFVKGEVFDEQVERVE